jgi:branched-chain amino acid aminotransferase
MDRVSDVAKSTTNRQGAAKTPFHANLQVWMDGEVVSWHEATVHIMAHVLHYGSSVFEGVRCYKTQRGPAIFRLREHVRRLYDSARIYAMKPEYSQEQFAGFMKDMVRVNRFEACYLRPLVYRGLGTPGVNPSSSPVCVAIVCWDWGKYLGDDSAARGVDVCVASWARMAPNTIPALAKASANYMNGQLIKLEAVRNGYSEGIALDSRGYVSEGSGENVFLVRDGVVRTPSTDAILPGITRDTALALLRDAGREVRTERITRDEVYIADEAFFTGTAAEITPIRELDRRRIGERAPGPVTVAVQQSFFAAAHGRDERYRHWLTPV